jgi:hypothetical protein
MRYYVYASATKVDQLYAQIPIKLREKIAAKLTIDLKIIKAEFQGRPAQDSLFSMLDIVVSYLENEGLVGTVEDPKSYFKGVMPLSWGPYLDMGINAPPVPDFVYFGGRTGHAIVGLGGSLKHVIGEVGTASSHSHSATPMMIRALRKVTRSTAFEQGIDVESAGILQCVELASGQMGGPWEPMEFVAKRLAYGPLHDVHWKTKETEDDRGFPRYEWERMGAVDAILGSPIYVAMADDQ